MKDILTEEYELYKSIMDLDDGIRFVTIVDSEGKLLFGGQREGISNYLKPDHQKDSLRHAIEAWQLRNKFSNYIGNAKYAIAEYDKIKRITIPIGDDKLIYITTEPNVDHTKLIENIRHLL